MWRRGYKGFAFALSIPGFLLRAADVSLPPREAGPNQLTALTVCIDHDGGFSVLEQATLMAGRMFAAIGVPIKWRMGIRACPDGAITASVIDHTQDSLAPGALAYSRLDDGAAIQVFSDRVHDYTACVPTNAPYCSVLEAGLMAHVLAHEITHLLEGTARHSAFGVMKARWDMDDYLEMRRKPLAFAPEDVQLIRAAMAARNTPVLFHSPVRCRKIRDASAPVCSGPTAQPSSKITKQHRRLS